MQVTLYSKPGCHLCEELKAELWAMQPDLGFQLVECNIVDDAQLFARFRYLIPVLEIAEGALLYPPHDMAAVYRALVAARAADDVENHATKARASRI